MDHPKRLRIFGTSMRPTVLHRPVVLAAAFAVLYAPAAPLVWAGPPFAEFVDPNPAAGNQFGAVVVALSTGNVVITSPFDDAGGLNAGAVYLFNGATGALISTLKGSSANDNIGSSGVTALTNGNYAVRSRLWDIPAGAADVGAVTWGSGTTGVSGVVSASNSLVGTTANDLVGTTNVVALTNGNYVVASAFWDNGGAADAGAATWGNGLGGTVGPVSASNSLVGTTAGDLNNIGLLALSNGNYAVFSRLWDNGVAVDAGAVTWGNGLGGTVGAVSASNSLVGTASNDGVGQNGLQLTGNGNYVVISPFWDGVAADVGAVTWGNGLGGTVGTVSPTNSLVGTTFGDQVGSTGVTLLTNGNYVVKSQFWNIPAGAADVGATTWGNGLGGTVGAVSASNSLVGTTALDQVGAAFALTNGNYVVASTVWDNGVAADAGAATWGNGLGGTVGAVSTSNSLVGTTASDQIGLQGVFALTNGNYVVASRQWRNGALANAGAVTWGSGGGGTVGAVSASNSLVGTQANDSVGYDGVLPLTNGNYVARSGDWANGAMALAGAATWGNGTSGITGAVSASNSIFGSSAGDQFAAFGGVAALTNGNYVISGPRWHNGAVANAGAATWGNGAGGTVGPVSAANSLVGTTASDQVGINGVTALTTGNYVVRSSGWDGGAVDVGAVTWGNGATGTSGAVSAANSLVGTTASDQVGGGGVTALTNGNYVVSTPGWDTVAGPLANAGAATWGNGLGGTVGVVSASNSLVGSVATSGLQGVGVDNVNGTHFARFVTDVGGRVRLGSQADGITPTLGAVTSSNITQSGADVSGSVLVGAGLPITARGFVYSKTATNSSPAIAGTGVTQIPLSGTTGAMSTPLGSLLSATGYSVRSYATNAAGTTYSTVATFTTLADPAISINDVSAQEGNSGTQTYTFTVTLSAPSSNAVAVTWTTQDGSAIAGSDYTAASNTLSFSAGQTTKTVLITVFGDTTPEPHETFSVLLSNPVNAAITKGTGAGVILNDDGGTVTPGVSINDPSVLEGNSGNSLLSFTVSLSAVSTSAVTVNYATSNGTATAGSDYTAGSGTFTIPAGVLSKNLVLLVSGDSTVEGDETFLVTLSSPAGAVVLKGVGLGTIVNDDPPVAATTVTQYRLYNDFTKEHLYTTDLNEYTVLGTVGWLQEGIAYKMLTDGIYGGVATVPLFRMYHPGILQHHWTTDSNETTTLSGTPFWYYEGIIGYVVPTQVSGTVPLYRMALANPALHLWTTDLNEYTVLQGFGWIPEGIIGYVVP